MDNIYAVVDNNSVINTVIWDGESEWSPEIGIPILTDGTVGIGWSYDGKSFTAPPEPAKTPEEQAAENLAVAQAEYDRATANITSLVEQIQDEDYDGTTEAAVKAELAAWTNYRKELRAYLKAADGSQMLPPSPTF